MLQYISMPEPYQKEKWRRRNNELITNRLRISAFLSQNFRLQLQTLLALFIRPKFLAKTSSGFPKQSVPKILGNICCGSINNFLAKQRISCYYLLFNDLLLLLSVVVLVMNTVQSVLKENPKLSK